MCNLYNVSTNQEAIRAFTRAMVDCLGNLEPSFDVYPDQMAPIVRNTPTGRELVRVRWGLPSSGQALLQAASRRADKLRAKSKAFDFEELLKMEPDGGTTNVRNTSSKHWTRWLGVEHRCLVPVTRFAEPDPARKVEGGRTPNAWFARDGDQPLMCFAGIWVPEWGERAQSQGRAHQGQSLRLPDDRAECDRRANPSEGYAGSAHRAGGSRDMDDSAMGRSEGAAAAAARPPVDPIDGVVSPQILQSQAISTCHGAVINWPDPSFLGVLQSLRAPPSYPEGEAVRPRAESFGR